VVALLPSCTYRTAIQRLSPEEQTTFRAYRKVMSTGQAHTYLHKATAAERMAYLEDIGLTQRFHALEPQDQEAVLSGFPRKGMHANALRFLWGEPLYARGPAGRYEYWKYFGSAFSLAEGGSSYTQAGTIMTVYLIDGHVDWWVETVPAPQETSEGDNRRQ
jgi:hypothetical protein